MLYAINYNKNKELAYFEIEDLREKIGIELFDEINKNAEKCILDLDIINFDEMCLLVNDILIKKGGFFLRIHEKKNKFRYNFHRTEEKNNTYKTLSSCIKTKFNGFTVAAPYLQNEIRKDLYPIDIVYKPIKQIDEVIECYFVTDIRYAYYGKVPNYKNQQITNRHMNVIIVKKFLKEKQFLIDTLKHVQENPESYIVLKFKIL